MTIASPFLFFPVEFPLHVDIRSLVLSRALFAKEQEEEINCWDGADGGASTSERHQSESELGHNFLCDDAKLDELPGPKFTSLRHLRQVILCSVLLNVFITAYEILVT